MSTLKSLFANVWLAATHIRKKAYTAGLIVMTGAAAVAFMFIGVQGFSGSDTIAHVSSYEVEEEDNSEVADKEVLTEETASEESLPYYVAWAMASYEAPYTFEADGDKTLAKEPETDKILKTASSETEDVETIIEALEPALSIKDYTALVRIVEAEATDEDLKGKTLIANVVLNRVKSSRFPDTIYGVVHQKLGGKAQFSPIDDGRYYTVPITKSTEKAVLAALKGTDYSQGALFFVAKSLASENASSWFDRNLNFIMTYGVHSFYKY